MLTPKHFDIHTISTHNIFTTTNSIENTALTQKITIQSIQVKNKILQPIKERTIVSRRENYFSSEFFMFIGVLETISTF